MSLADPVDLTTARGIELREVDTSGGGAALELVLVQPVFADLFDALVLDVAAEAAKGTTAGEIASLVAGRVKRWQLFLQGFAEGLSIERQRGLFGELTLLFKTLIPELGCRTAVHCWTGPLAAQQDFCFGRLAIEVKTTTAKQPQSIRITSERQLDTTALDHLVLFHLSVDAREGAGRSLPELVRDVRTSVAADAAAASELEERLFAAGYHDIHEPRYPTGYTQREINTFEVKEPFPRIVEADCPAGVGDVQYSIAIGALTGFRVDEETLSLLLQEAVALE
jgi:hypothetical protein